tara:strand:+ start:295 stop:531 length:237 start_codon:yes stop_codon:yes gene_type:complete
LKGFLKYRLKYYKVLPFLTPFIYTYRYIRGAKNFPPSGPAYPFFQPIPAYNPYGVIVKIQKSGLSEKILKKSLKILMK